MHQHSDVAIPAVLYAAKSTLDPNGSIPTQLEDARAMAKREGWEIVGEHKDEAASAWSGNRGPGLAAAKEHAEREAPSVLLVQHSDRLARGDGRIADHLADVLAWAVRSNVTIRSVQDDFLADERMGRVMAAVMGLRNTEDSARKSKSVKDGHRRRRRKGKHHGGPRPYGYDYERDKEGKPIKDGDLLKVESEAAIVRRIFAEYVAGASQLAITRNLKADGVPTIRGGEWHQGTVRTILANPIYAGLIRDGDDVVEGEHDPIIDSGLWHKAEALRTSKARTHGRGRPPVGHHLFRNGMLRCGECGEAMIPRTTRNRASAPSEVYRCYGRHRDKDSCSMPPLPRAEIDGSVYTYFERVGLDVEATRAAVAESVGRKAAEVQALLDQAERQAQKADDRLTRVRRDYQDGKLEADDWAQQRDELEAEQQAARSEVDRLAQAKQDAENGGALIDVEGETLRRLSEIRKAITGEINDASGTDAVRAAFSRLFDGFTVHRRATKRVRGKLTDYVWVEPQVSDPVIEEGGESLAPRLRVPLLQAGNKQCITLTR